MPFPSNIDEISSQGRRELAGTHFECESCTPLSGGNANFVFRGRLAKPLSNGTQFIIIKHGEGYVSSNPAIKLTTSRCVRAAAADASPQPSFGDRPGSITATLG